MNLLLLDEPDRELGAGDDRFVIGGRRARHVVETLGKAPGDTLRAGLVEGPFGEATVIAVENDRVRLETRFEGEAPPRPRTDLIVAVPRPKSLKKLLFEAAVLGVDRLVLLRTWRVDKSYLGSPLLSPEGHRPVLIEGLEQARHTRLPEVRVEPLFKPFVEDRAAAFATGARAVVLHPSRDGRHLAEDRLASDARLVLAIGPEGGFLPYEVETFEAAGFVRRHLGPRILRVESACVAALATAAAVRIRPNVG